MGSVQMERVEKDAAFVANCTNTYSFSSIHSIWATYDKERLRTQVCGIVVSIAARKGTAWPAKAISLGFGHCFAFTHC